MGLIFSRCRKGYFCQLQDKCCRKKTFSICLTAVTFGANIQHFQEFLWFDIILVSKFVSFSMKPASYSRQLCFPILDDGEGVLFLPLPPPISERQIFKVQCSKIVSVRVSWTLFNSGTGSVNLDDVIRSWSIDEMKFWASIKVNRVKVWWKQPFRVVSWNRSFFTESGILKMNLEIFLQGFYVVFLRYLNILRTFICLNFVNMFVNMEVNYEEFRKMIDAF